MKHAIFVVCFIFVHNKGDKLFIYLEPILEDLGHYGGMIINWMCKQKGKR